MPTFVFSFKIDFEHV
jgi:hypothetical protein